MWKQQNSKEAVVAPVKTNGKGSIKTPKPA